MGGVRYWLATPIGDLATFAAESGYLVTWSFFLDLAIMSKRRRTSEMPLTSDPEVVLQYLDMSSDDDSGSDDSDFDGYVEYYEEDFSDDMETTTADTTALPASFSASGNFPALVRATTCSSFSTDGLGTTLTLAGANATPSIDTVDSPALDRTTTATICSNTCTDNTNSISTCTTTGKWTVYNYFCHYYNNKN